MKQRFIILIDDATRDQQNAVTSFFKGKFAYWHHFSDAWLITTEDAEWTPGKIRDELYEVAPGIVILVMKIESHGGWSGRGKKGMFSWLRSYWANK